MSITCHCKKWELSHEIIPDLTGLTVLFFGEDMTPYEEEEDEPIFIYEVTVDGLNIDDIRVTSKHAETNREGNKLILRTESDKIKLHVNGFYDVFYESDDAREGRKETLTIELKNKHDIRVTPLSKVYAFGYYNKVPRTNTDEQVLPEIIDGLLHVRVGKTGYDSGIRESFDRCDIECVDVTKYYKPEQEDTIIRFRGIDNYTTQLLCAEHSMENNIIGLEYEYYLITPLN